MITSKEVTAMRRAGSLNEAYAASLDLIAAPEADDWDRAAHGWCLIDLVKRCAAEGNQTALAEWLRRLEAFEPPAENDILASGKERALALGRADRREAMKAQALSKQKRHEEAADIYARLHTQGALRPEDCKSWGWDLYHIAREDLRKAELSKTDGDEIPPAIVQRVKRCLNTYLTRCSMEPEPRNPTSGRGIFQAKPASVNLHSVMLTLALRLTKGNHLKALPFLRLWNPDRLTEEDFASQTGSDGKTYVSLAERALQAAAAEAIEGDRPDDLRFILPHVEAALKRFPEHIWLKLHLVKLLRGLRKTGEARALAIEFAREKATEYWVWDLIADLSPGDAALQLSCFAKALICSQDDDFVGKVRLKLAALVADQHPAEARFEVERVLSHRAHSGYRIPRDAKAMSESAWFAAASPKSTDRDFYARFTEEADALLFSHLPWTDASLGDIFTVDGKDGQKPRRRRRIYVREHSTALELNLPDTHADVRGLAAGTPLLVQYETSRAEPWRTTIHRVRPRPDGSAMDAVPERIGVIDHVNWERSLIHVIVARGVDGVCPISAYPGDPKVGVAVAVRMARSHGRSGERTHILSMTTSEQSPSPTICRTFLESTEVSNRGFGFTQDDIFIPQHLVAAAGIASGDLVEGTAILSYDKKGGKWGMKAVEARSVANSCKGST
ncbi:hypothetical protein QM467_01525 [Rhodoblastus sp. 17X3]|uniref:DUF7017 domain-containing protein n=1 Tax=Rhodoblastus sp. 17X3 TaxID=3047026 RepID=UPI0024B66623|nr:hypothetical protein [Rhodoblastus sp. 17X3]MDI9846734.1 hypothetical protein [Rhodoblastus sp. 17X3]